jgi:hypothetical protein
MYSFIELGHNSDNPRQGQPLQEKYLVCEDFFGAIEVVLDEEISLDERQR